MNHTSKEPHRKPDTITARVFVAVVSSLLTLGIVTALGNLSSVSLIKLLGGVTKSEFEETLKTLVPWGASVRLGTELTDLYLAAPGNAEKGQTPLLFGNNPNAETEWWTLTKAK